MCTAISFHTKDHYFGRNLDLEYHYDEQVVITPRRYPLRFRRLPALHAHHAMIGMATVADGYPLYYEATNEHGVSMAGLSFPGSAVYRPCSDRHDNAAPFEFIPWVLGQCCDMAQVRALLGRVSLLEEPFSAQLPLSPLHWMITWKGECLVAEPMASGLCIHENPVGVMTNNPPFPVQLWHLARFARLAPAQAESGFAPPLCLPPDSNGMGALGLPGDWSSPSRFVRAAFALHASRCEGDEESSVAHFFHLLAAVAMPRGSVLVHGKPEITVYSCCCNADRGVYYYTTYENSRVTSVDMRRCDLNGSALLRLPLETKASFLRL